MSKQASIQTNMSRQLRRYDVTVGAFVVQVCIKVVSCGLLSEIAGAIRAEWVFDGWMVAETEVSLKLIVPTESPDSRGISQQPIIPDGSDMKNLLGHVGERLAHIGKMPDLLKTICKLLMLQYQTQVDQMRDTGYGLPLNTVLVLSNDGGGVAKDAIIEIQRRDADIGVVLVIMVKKTGVGYKNSVIQ